jgi:nicotinamide phosphoribosyltransferase
MDIFKDPATGNGDKKSATGRLAVVRDDQGELTLIQKATPEQEAVSELQTVWKDGQWVRRESFAEVRETIRKEMARVFK